MLFYDKGRTLWQKFTQIMYTLTDQLQIQFYCKITDFFSHLSLKKIVKYVVLVEMLKVKIFWLKMYFCVNL